MPCPSQGLAPPCPAGIWHRGEGGGQIRTPPDDTVPWFPIGSLAGGAPSSVMLQGCSVLLSSQPFSFHPTDSEPNVPLPPLAVGLKLFGVHQFWVASTNIMPAWLRGEAPWEGLTKRRVWCTGHLPETKWRERDMDVMEGTQVGTRAHSPTPVPPQGAMLGASSGSCVWHCSVG